MEKITIGIIDDHKIVRQGLKELLQKIINCKVTHEYENGKDFLAALPMNPAPDLLVLDYSMPGLNGIDILKILEKRKEEYKVLLLTQHIDEQVIDEAYLLVRAVSLIKTVPPTTSNSPCKTSSRLVTIISPKCSRGLKTTKIRFLKSGPTT
jgi:DNA-binding NarL/FixJ family response regulator